MGRHGDGGDRRGAHRSGPAGGGRLAAATHLLGTTVPRRVRPPRLLNVMLVSGVTLALVLFGYSTTQIYLRFNDPHGESGTGPAPGASHLPSAEPGHPSQDAGDPSRGDTRNTADENGQSGGTAVSYQTVDATSGNFTGKVTITNSGGGRLDDWVLKLGFSRATVTSAGGAEWQATDSGVVVRKPEGDKGLAPGESKTVNVTVDGAEQTPSCTLNGHSCGF